MMMQGFLLAQVSAAQPNHPSVLGLPAPLPPTGVMAVSASTAAASSMDLSNPTRAFD